MIQIAPKRKVKVKGGSEQEIARVFQELGYGVVHDPKEADIMVLGGGPDINPNLYGQEDKFCSYVNKERDESDLRFTNSFRGKPFIGICRGAQLLNVLHGGLLWQDVDEHREDHGVLDVPTNEWISTVSSTHHQLMRPAKGAVVQGIAWESTYYADDRCKVKNVKFAECEVIEYHDEKGHSLCFQGHPETCDSTMVYFDMCVDRFFKRICN